MPCFCDLSLIDVSQLYGLCVLNSCTLTKISEFSDYIVFFAESWVWINFDFWPSRGRGTEYLLLLLRQINWFISFQFNPASVLEVLFGLIFGFSIFLFFGLCRRVYIFFSFTFTLVQQISWFDSFIFAIVSVFWFWQESWKLWRDHCVQKVWIPYYSRPLSSCMTSHLFYLFSEPYFDNIFWQHHPNEIRDKHKKVFILYV